MSTSVKKVISVGQVQFEDAMDLTDSYLLEIIKTRKTLHFWNAYCVSLAAEDSKFKDVASNPDSAVFADGAPVALVMWLKARRTGKPLSRQVRGTDFLRRVTLLATNEDFRQAFYGATPEVILAMVKKLRIIGTSQSVVDAYSPAFGADLTGLVEEISSRVSKNKPDLVWLGLGTPKQDHVAIRLSKLHPKTTFACVGAAFDFYAGHKREAPVFVQKLGFEWFFRLLSEPKRLWRRYLVGNVKFLIKVSRSR